MHVVAIDYGVKRNILRLLAGARRRGHRGAGQRPAPRTSWRMQPDGIFLSNGPGDPAATGEYAVPVIQDLLEDRHAGVRHLPRPPDAGAGARRHDREDAPGPSRRQPSGQGSHDRQGRDRVDEPRLRGRSASAAGKASRKPMSRCSTAPIAASRSAGRPVFSVQHHPEASPGPQDQPLSVPPLRQPDPRAAKASRRWPSRSTRAAAAGGSNEQLRSGQRSSTRRPALSHYFSAISDGNRARAFQVLTEAYPAFSK